MVRTQLQIDEDTYESLRKTAHSQRKSMSAVVREVLREHLAEDKPRKAMLKEEFSFIGSGSSGKTDISVHHDDYLAEDFA